MLKRSFLFALIGGFIGFTSCETDFSLNGDYKPIPVVFGLLDHTDSIHKIKITKAFLGDGDNLVYAQNPDSNYFKQVDAQVIEIDENGDKTGREWQLVDSIITNKDENGIFYGPEQKIYYFEENALNMTYTYQIVGDINEGQHNFSAETGLINGFSIPSSEFLSNKVAFAKNTVDEIDDYLTWRIDPTPGENAAEFEVSYTLYWTEHYINGSSAPFSLKKYDSKSQDIDDLINISGGDFYEWVSTQIPVDDNVVNRTFDNFDLHISVAHANLKQYMEVGQPVSGIAQIQPVFTNIDGGFGLFSSRLLFSLTDQVLDASSMKELANGLYTKPQSFCSSNPLHSSEFYFCP